LPERERAHRFLGAPRLNHEIHPRLPTMNPAISVNPSAMNESTQPAAELAKGAPLPSAPTVASGQHPAAAAEKREIAFDIQDLSIYYGNHQAVKNVNLQIPAMSVTAIIGPSGCGKSTALRALNRMHELTPGARHTGKVLLRGEDLHSANVDATLVRRRVGMVFQKSNPFPTLSIAENVLVGLRLNGVRDKALLARRLEESLRMAALWDEVKDVLHKPGTSLSGGQQQRLCIARALAVRPEILLMDEPCSALDPIATAKVEELIHALKSQYTVVIVTHNMQQAARVSENTAFFYMGRLIEFGPTEQIFMNPRDKQTEAYVSGRFG
jgi:phosphate transport system ATP-binding protein